MKIKWIAVLLIVVALVWLFDRKYDKGGYWNAQYHRDTFWKAEPDTLPESTTVYDTLCVGVEEGNMRGYTNEELILKEISAKLDTLIARKRGTP